MSREDWSIGAKPERLALLACATYAGTARDRDDDTRRTFWTDAAAVMRASLGRVLDMEAAS